MKNVAMPPSDITGYSQATLTAYGEKCYQAGLSESGFEREGWQAVCTTLNKVAVVMGDSESSPDPMLAAMHDRIKSRIENTEATQALADMEDALCAMLPGPYYMDPPDGGSVTVLEQVRRMSEDAARWRYLVSQHEAPSPDVLCVFAPGANLRLVPVGSMPGELEAFVDTARKL